MTDKFLVGNLVVHVTCPELKWVVVSIEKPSLMKHPNGQVVVERMTKKNKLKKLSFPLTTENCQWSRDLYIAEQK